MKLKFLYAFLAVIIFSVTAFAQNAELKGKWFLNELTADGTPILLFTKNPFPKKISIDFRDKESFGLASSCNSMGGKYTLGAGGKFQTGSIFSTKMFCAGGAMEIENALSKALSAVTEYEIKKGILILRDKRGKNVLQFSQNNETTETQPESKEITLYVDNKKVDCRGIVPMKCFQIKESDSKNWSLFYDRIENFKFQKGFYYILKVKRTKVKNPMKDTSGFHYELVEIVKKTKRFVKG